MLDHLSFSVNDYKESKVFYDATLSFLGIERLMTFETEDHSVAGYGAHGKPFFWIGIDVKPNVQELVGKARGFM